MKQCCDCDYQDEVEYCKICGKVLKRQEETELGSLESLPDLDVESAIKEDQVGYFMKRWVAATMDLFVVAGLLSFWLIAYVYMRELFMGPLLFLWIIIPVAAITLYFVIFEGLIGYTLGKRIMGIRVVSQKGQRPGLTASFLRTLLRLADINPLVGGIPGIIVVLCTKKRQRIGDMAANTYVVTTKALESIPSAPLNKKERGICKLVAVLLVALFGFNLVCLGLGKPYVDKPKKANIYTSQDKSFSITIPDLWEFKKAQSEEDVWVFAPEALDSAAIALSRQKISQTPSNGDLKRHSQIVCKALCKKMKYRVLNTKTTVFHHFPAVKYQMVKSDITSERDRMDVIIFRTTKYYYHYISNFPEDNWQYEDDLALLAKSLKIKE
jgi:uncharacterized RDD family membrane protein YckC